MTSVLRMSGITKRFPGVLALDGVDFEVRAGEVHGLLGENGAGKSTLMKILGGIYTADEGTIEVAGEPVTFSGPREAMAKGISVVHQELQLCPNVTVAENIFLGEGAGFGAFRPIRHRELRRRAQDLLDDLGVPVRADAMVEDLPIGQRQMVEIAKALTHDLRVLVLDEPTSSLSDADAEFLFATMARLQQRGVGIVYISHRMKEVFRLCDRATVLRDGRKVETIEDMRSVTPDKVVSLMVGRELATAEHVGREPGAVALDVRGLTRRGAFYDCSFQVRAGEVVGFAGLVGAGRTELMRAIVGADPYDAGTVIVGGKEATIRTVADSMRHGMALVPEDRKRDGLVLEMSVGENLWLIAMRQLHRYTFVQDRSLRRLAAEYVQKLNVRTPHLEQEIQYLSGGNQQKVVIAKWLTTRPRILILDEPTRGIDIGAKAEIYEMIRDLAHQGTAIILVSSELPEVLANSDRIIVMADGHIAGELSREEATEDAVMALSHSDVGEVVNVQR